ncbi:short-chain dehydrogenase [Halarcobacter ebronensis]|uniref:Short-chain dehydrogenase n=1 Tax=Halarcobacter ebronensis TaxID=1462615 RepID=A0A4Q0YG18_9BACT|nr:SDR family NAD(P)-dependent oxidoreductase [Halarcobacter ebronensis]RXJ69520.1 short-chain dehydrogenase [Halarcobacter ebronensis]
MENQKRIWLVGGSSGIGLELVKLLLENDYKIIVSARNATSSKDLIDLCLAYPQKLYLLNFNVLEEDLSLKIKEAWSIYDGLDIWFYNAGVYDMMSIKQWDKNKFINMNSTNYLGVIKIMTEIVPYFIKQGFGRWIWNLSLSTYFGLPNGGGYSAPKAALLNLAQSIQPELKLNNINLQVINHGFVKTRLTAKNSFDMPQLMTPQYAAKKIYEGLEKNSGFEISFPFKLGFFLRLLNLLPYKISLALTKKILP